ncbi:hypothetical protein [Exiguobacterium sp. S3]|uniref:hypothetical protein n=1 Tax=Exiguobacterium sp. S3 TaxID=483245 RepID=UPI0022AF27EC|nr:hypothetical protein [Exiguobacterium sp. KJ 601]
MGEDDPFIWNVWVSLSPNNFSKSSIYGMNQRVLTSIRCSAGYRRNFLSIQIPSI